MNNMERKERFKLAKEIAKQHPDWGYRKVNAELQKQTGQGLNWGVINALVTKTKVEAYSKHDRIRMAEDFFRKHPDWGYRKANEELRKRTGQGLHDQLVREIKRRTLGLKKKPARYITYFSAGGASPNRPDYPSISSKQVFGTFSWPYRVNLDRLLEALDYGIPELMPNGPYRLKAFTVWSYSYQMYRYDDVAGDYKLIRGESDGEDRGI